MGTKKTTNTTPSNSVGTCARDMSRCCEELHLEALKERLTLLALLARRDTSTWIRVLKDTWPNEAVVESINSDLAPMVDDKSLVAEYLVGVNVVVRELTDLAFLAGTTSHDRPTSAAFNGALRLIKKLDSGPSPVWDDDDDHLILPSVPLIVDIELENRSTSDAARILETIHGYVQRQCAATRNNTGRTHLEILELSSTAMNIDIRGLALLAKIHALGVIVSSLPDLECDDASLETASTVAGALQSLVLADVDPQSLSFPLRGVDEVAISDAGSLRKFTAVLSAIQDCTSLQHVSVRMNRNPVHLDDDALDEMDKKWTCLAQSLFSRYALHQVDSLNISVAFLLEEDMETVVDALAYEEAQYGNHSVRRLTASKFYLTGPVLTEDETEQLSPHKNTECGFPFTSSKPLSVRVVDELDDNVIACFQVILPGRGVAWVHEGDVVKATSSSEANPRQRANVRSFRELSIDNVTHISVDSVVGLLGLIGSETEELQISMYGAEFDMDDWYRHIVTVCPQLKQLAFNQAQFTSLHAIVAAAADELCRLQCLSVGVIHTSPAGHACDFFDALCDPYHPLTVHLQQLSLEIKYPNDDVLMAALRMLETNRTLRKITLSFSIAAAESDAWRARFFRHVHEAASIPVGKLEMRSRLAFLSVVYGKQTQLESGIISSIFQFAARSVTRECDVEFN